MSKKYGLAEAQEDAKDPQFLSHWSVVRRVLQRAGVKIVVGQQVSKLVGGAKAVVAQTNQAIANYRVRDAEDEQIVVKQIGNLRSERDNRAKANTEAITGYGKNVASQEAEIARLEGLAKTFA